MILVLGVCVAGKTGLSAHAPASMSGVASWYGRAFENRRMADGCPYHRHALTAASRVLPLGSQARVRLKGREVVVLITDRGPYYDRRVIDLSEAAATQLGMHETGTARVEIELIASTPATIPPSCRPKSNP